MAWDVLEWWWRVVVARIQALEQAVEKMRQQQDQLQRRLKDEVERKAKLEVRQVATPEMNLAHPGWGHVLTFV